MRVCTHAPRGVGRRGNGAPGNGVRPGVRESGRCLPGIAKTAGGVPERVLRLLDVWAGEVTVTWQGLQAKAGEIGTTRGNSGGSLIAQARNWVRRGSIPVADAATAGTAVSCGHAAGSTCAVPEANNMEPRPREIRRDGESITRTVVRQWRRQPHSRSTRLCSSDRLTREPLGHVVCRGSAPDAEPKWGRSDD